MGTARLPRARSCVVAIALAVGACDGSAIVETGDAPASADHTVATLHAHHVGAWKVSNGSRHGQPVFDVEVLDHDLAAAIRVLRESASPLPSSETDNASASMPTPSEEHQRSVAAIARELERTLHLWSGVTAARVHITTPRNPTTVRGAGGVVPKAVVALRVRGADAPSEADVRALVANAVVDLAQQDVQVIQVPVRPLPKAPLVQVGPIAVTPGSAWVLRGLLVALLSLTAALTVGLLWLWRRRRATNATND